MRCRIDIFRRSLNRMWRSGIRSAPQAGIIGTLFSKTDYGRRRGGRTRDRYFPAEASKQCLIPELAAVPCTEIAGESLEEKTLQRSVFFAADAPWDLPVGHPLGARRGDALQKGHHQESHNPDGQEGQGGPPPAQPREPCGGVDRMPRRTISLETGRRPDPGAGRSNLPPAQAHHQHHGRHGPEPVGPRHRRGGEQTEQQGGKQGGQTGCFRGGVHEPDR